MPYLEKTWSIINITFLPIHIPSIKITNMDSYKWVRQSLINCLFAVTRLTVEKYLDSKYFESVPENSI